MSNITFYRTIGANNGDVVVAFDPTREHPVLTANSVHPNFKAIVEGLEAGDESVFELFDVAGGMARAFTQVTDRVAWDGANILWDGDPIHSVLSEQVMRALEHGETNYRALALFWEKLESNPNEHSRTMAYEWLASHDFKITEDGDVVGYKGVRADGYSTRAGHAFVDGKEYGSVNKQGFVQGQYIPNEDGTVVSMPRSEVAHNPNAACHTGLHIGDWSFGSTFGGARTKRVHFNPRDICSVPGHANKVRVCRYEVICDAEAPVEGGPVLKSDGTDSDFTWKADVGYVAR